MKEYGPVSAFCHLAQEHCEISHSRVIVVPYIDIQKMLKQAGSDCSPEECCIAFVKNYLEKAEELSGKGA